MSSQPHTRWKDYPDKAATDRAERDAAMKQCEARHQQRSHAEWMGERRLELGEGVVTLKSSRLPQ